MVIISDVCCASSFPLRWPDTILQKETPYSSVEERADERTGLYLRAQLQRDEHCTLPVANVGAHQVGVAQGPACGLEVVGN
jgi:hypothetical protein